MRGSPLFRALIAFAVLLSLGYPLWRLTRVSDAPTAALPTASVAGPKAIGLHLTFTLAPKSLAVRHLETEIWKETAPTLDMEREIQLVYPAEGVDLQFHIDWPEEGSLAALRVKFTDPAGDTHEKSIWGKGAVDAVLTVP
jgi:hypothetical protein